MSKPKDVVLIPAYRRPEFLVLCLERIAKNPDFRDYRYLFAVDNGYDPATWFVAVDFINRFRLDGRVLTPPKEDPNVRVKLAYNLLGGYARAYEESDRYVFMIEEDILVANDFFRWHKAVHEAEPSLFCAIATRNNNRDVILSGSLEEYYTSHGDYQSLGVSFRKGRVALFLNHLESEYFYNPSAYCKRNFPDSKIPLQYCSQDGFIRRVQEASSYATAFPHYPRAYHAGFVGTNRTGQVQGASLKDRVSNLRKIVFNNDAMRQHALKPEYFEDSMPVPLENGPWEKQVKRQP